MHELFCIRNVNVSKISETLVSLVKCSCNIFCKLGKCHFMGLHSKESELVD